MTKARAAPAITGSPSAQLARFMARYDPAVVKAARQVRALLRHQMPAAHVTSDVLQTLVVRALLVEALAQADPPMPAHGRGRLIVRSGSANQRSRRAAGR